ncbi:hypothetical protein AXF42_Ash004171 [Apostasia shenzhenica]|uniref:Uncharacterized protein n=1 Tax=Apostasia shenzhenica TaxID=1088818 RepID=A0A2I0A259_9ASPA|nr:hypothetical protein AXF42_Ash004171 [Apostasia shenzhenica]
MNQTYSLNKHVSYELELPVITMMISLAITENLPPNPVVNGPVLLSPSRSINNSAFSCHGGAPKEIKTPERARQLSEQQGSFCNGYFLGPFAFLFPLRSDWVPLWFDRLAKFPGCSSILPRCLAVKKEKITLIFLPLRCPTSCGMTLIKMIRVYHP